MVDYKRFICCKHVDAGPKRFCNIHHGVEHDALKFIEQCLLVNGYLYRNDMWECYNKFNMTQGECFDTLDQLIKYNVLTTTYDSDPQNPKYVWLFTER